MRPAATTSTARFRATRLAVARVLLCATLPALAAMLTSVADARPTQDAGGGVTARATADTQSIRIGEQFHVQLTITRPEGTTIESVVPVDSLEGIEALSGEKIADAPGEGGAGTISSGMRFTMTSFDTGVFAVPAFRIAYRSPGYAELRTVESAPIAIFVSTVEVDSAGTLRDIKPPLEAPLTFAEILPWIAGLLLLVAAAWLVRRYLRNRKEGVPFIPPPPLRPAYEEAADALRSLESENLWQRGKVKEYHTALSTILRHYIERQFRIPALESTSEEILSTPVIRSLGEPAGRLRNVLEPADLVKFAKFVPTPDVNEAGLKGAFAFLEATRPRAAAAPAAVSATSAPGSPGSPGTPARPAEEVAA